MTEAYIKLILAMEEADLADTGTVSLNEVNVSAVIVAGLELQDHQ